MSRIDLDRTIVERTAIREAAQNKNVFVKPLLISGRAARPRKAKAVSMRARADMRA